MDDDAEHVIEDFYGVYMLYSTNPKYLGRTYIGYTVNPNRRVNQHNKGSQFGGARRTSNKGPWDMVLIVHGFPNDVAALRFEWAWQHPHRSRRLANVSKTRTTRRTIDFCLRIVSEMLNVGPWNRLPLTIRWLKPAYQRDLPLPLPTHMSIMRGPLVTKRLPTGDTQQMPSTSSSRCGLCRKDLPPQLALSCVSCDHSCHATCLAAHFLRFCPSYHIIPVQGQCPKCASKCLWGDLVRKKKGVKL